VRVLVVSAPMVGHLLPMVPFARTLRDAGHEVLLATAADALAGPEVGLPVEDIAPTLRFARIARRTMLRHPLIAKAEFTGAAGTRGVSLLFAAVNEQMADGVIALADRWAANLVIYEPLAVVGALAAARRRVPAVLHENSLYDGAHLVQATAARLRAVLARHGVDALPANAATVTIAPPSLVGSRAGWPMRCLPYSGQGALPDWLRQRPQRARIAVSHSTVGSLGSSGLISAVVAAASRVDAEFVVVRPDRRTRRRSALPGNVRTVGWVSLAKVLPTCTAIVHHGGAGTVLGALAAGLPQLIAPGPGDRTHNAQLVAARGVGLAVAAKYITAVELTRLITDPALASAAVQVQQEMIAMPEPEQVVARLHTLIARRSGDA
jgi:Erythromycin biosynthesis protein CIII-like, C-terminal domain/Erythromycin biosynthesis protein CIII-like, N-terminal domain